MRTKVMTSCVLLGLFALAGATWAARGDDRERKSKNGKADGTAGGAQIVLEYGRPNVAGRQIFGVLVPYGQVWRAGADEATTIAFDKDVAIEGKPLAAGRYALFLIPSEGEWTVVFNKIADQWGAFKHDPASDALRVTVKPAAHDRVETLEYAIAGDRVEMRWDTVAVGFSVKAAD
ncbi:MAG: DUF2911 domain-containing protein [Thermoanaerobaculia bacterium]